MNSRRYPVTPATPYEQFKEFCLKIKLWHVEWELEAFERDRKSLERVTRDAILRRASLTSCIRNIPIEKPASYALAPVLVLRPAARDTA
jgi:hypothetical protein